MVPNIPFKTRLKMLIGIAKYLKLGFNPNKDFFHIYPVEEDFETAKEEIPKPKEEKIKALDFLDQKGVFKITKASNLLCDAFQVSRYTLYGYLEEAKNLRKSEEK